MAELESAHAIIHWLYLYLMNVNYPFAKISYHFTLAQVILNYYKLSINSIKFNYLQAPTL